MIVQGENNSVFRGDVISTTSFKMKPSAKAFKLLSSEEVVNNAYRVYVDKNNLSEKYNLWLAYQTYKNYSFDDYNLYSNIRVCINKLHLDIKTSNKFDKFINYLEEYENISSTDRTIYREHGELCQKDDTICNEILKTFLDTMTTFATSAPMLGIIKSHECGSVLVKDYLKLIGVI